MLGYSPGFPASQVYIRWDWILSKIINILGINITHGVPSLSSMYIAGILSSMDGLFGIYISGMLAQIFKKTFRYQYRQDIHRVPASHVSLLAGLFRIPCLSGICIARILLRILDLSGINTSRYDTLKDSWPFFLILIM